MYYEKDLAPLVTLAEFADDPALARRAATFADLVLFDLALHSHRGNVGCTHGRSYMKDKSRATDQPVFAPLKMCFDATDEPWPVESGDDADLLPRNEGATLLARATRYRPPDVLRRIATSAEPMVDREGMGVAIDPAEPLVEHPTRADGLSYTDPDMVPFWWDRGALTPWQLIPLMMDTLDRHHLWDAWLFEQFRVVRSFAGDDRATVQRLSHDLHPMVNAGLLGEVNTYTWRNGHGMLSTAQSYRPGCVGFQHHVWQATLDERAVVFTVHPGNEPDGPRRGLPGQRPVLDRQRHPAPFGPAGPGRAAPVRTRVQAAGHPGAGRVRLLRLHPRLLPDRVLRRGGRRRPLDPGPAR